MTQMAVECHHLIKRYDEKFALNDFNVAIPKRRIAGILGPNGSGKSSLFRLLTGLVRPDQGTIDILGQKPGWQTNKKIAYLPDRARWYPKHTVARAFEWAENLLPGFALEDAKQLAKFMDMKLDMKTSGMSRGQEARLMLILCIARDVPLIVLDEPFSGIDVISREHIIEGIIDYLGDRDQTILISTHEIHEVEGLFDYAVFMDQGAAIWSGEIDALRAKYGSLQMVFRKFYREGLSL